MILYKEKVLSLLKSAKSLPNIWLLFGNDDGEIRMIIQKIIKQVNTNESELIKVNSDVNMKEVMFSRSLFEKNKIVIVNDATDSFTSEITDIIDKVMNQDYLIIQGGELKKNSKLRILFEEHNKAIALHCYKLNAFIEKIEQELRINGLTYEIGVPEMLVNIISNDSQIICNEIKKLSLFFADSLNKKITLNMLSNFISNSAEGSLDRLFLSIVLNNKNDLINEMNKMNRINTLFIVRAYQNFLIRMISVQRDLGKIGIEAAMNKLKPPLFGQPKSDFIFAVKQSRIENNLKLLQNAIQIECDFKSISGIELQQIFLQNVVEQIYQ